MPLDDLLSKTMATQERNVGTRFIQSWFVQSYATVSFVSTFRNSQAIVSSVESGKGGESCGSRSNEKEQ